MKKNTIFVLILLAVALAKIKAQTSGTSTVNVVPATRPTSLLPGQTPATLVVPAGWTLVAKEDFEGSPATAAAAATAVRAGVWLQPTHQVEEVTATARTLSRLT
jgi:hypothetical protein